MAASGTPIDPKIKAKAVNELVAGSSYSQVAKKYKLNQRTVERWWSDLNGDGKKRAKAPSERKVNAYHAALEKFALAALKMLEAQAELLADKEYIRNRETSDVIRHTEFLANRLIKHIELNEALRNAQSVAALPEGAQQAIEPEIMEEVA